MDQERLEELYEDHVLREAESPYHKWRLVDAMLSGSARNPLCGDLVWLDLEVDQAGRIIEACHDATGCVISRAGASLLCRYVEGTLIDELRSLPANEMHGLIRVPLSPTRQRCALLAYECLQRMLLSSRP